MAATDTSALLLDEALELAALLRPAWDDIDAAIPAWHPRNEGSEGAEAEAEAEAGEEEEKPDDAGEKEEVDWKAMARKHERDAKNARKKLQEREQADREREEANQSEQEKALRRAREEAKAEALAEGEQERRNDRLEVAVARLGAKEFADVDDALLHIKRDISSGDVDPDDIFNDEGKVQTEALKKALADLLERKPHLKAQRGPAGDADAGRGRSADADMSVDDHLKKVQGRS